MRRYRMYKNKYTGDLFGVEDCPNCNGTGTVVEKLIFNDMFPMPMGEREEDCDICEGSGVLNEK
jgi:DnaJ-class molecular chaperone